MRTKLNLDTARGQNKQGFCEGSVRVVTDVRSASEHPENRPHSLVIQLSTHFHFMLRGGEAQRSVKP